jgi:hypothetical protein
MPHIKAFSPITGKEQHRETENEKPNKSENNTHSTSDDHQRKEALPLSSSKDQVESLDFYLHQSTKRCPSLYTGGCEIGASEEPELSYPPRNNVVLWESWTSTLSQCYSLDLKCHPKGPCS